MESSCERVLRIRRSSARCRSFFAISTTLDGKGKKKRIAWITLDVKGSAYDLAFMAASYFIPRVMATSAGVASDWRCSGGGGAGSERVHA
jgi:hypothetical protein